MRPGTNLCIFSKKPGKVQQLKISFLDMREDLPQTAARFNGRANQ